MNLKIQKMEIYINGSTLKIEQYGARKNCIRTVTDKRNSTV